MLLMDKISTHNCVKDNKLIKGMVPSFIVDGLDRVRFNGLDFRQLRTPYARRLPLVAGGLLEEPLLECIENYRAGKLEVPDA